MLVLFFGLLVQDSNKFHVIVQHCSCGATWTTAPPGLSRQPSPHWGEAHLLSKQPEIPALKSEPPVSVQNTLIYRYSDVKTVAYWLKTGSAIQPFPWQRSEAPYLWSTRLESTKKKRHLTGCPLVSCTALYWKRLVLADVHSQGLSLLY